MIQAHELRIGNYILMNGQLQQVFMINQQTAQVNFSSVDSNGQATDGEGCTLANAQPVPLTEDILQQCRFVYHDYFKFWQLITGTGDLRSEMDIDRDFNIIDFMRRPFVKKVSSLHQLQNIYFMLLGKELPFQPKVHNAPVTADVATAS